MITKLSKNQIEILKHTLYRAAKGLYCGDSPDMQSLVKRGMMCSQGTTGFCPDEFFCITALGHETYAETLRHSK